MKNVLRYRSIVFLLACASLAGCITQQPTPVYRLDTGAAKVPDRAQGAAVLLGPVTLADYLQRGAVVQRLEDGSLAVDATQGEWAGSLDENIDHLLLRNLAWRLDTQRVELKPASKGFSPDIQVEVDITRLDSGPQHPAVLEAQWRLLDKSGKRQASRLVRLQEEHLGSTADQVRAQSELLQRLSEMMSEAITPILVAKTSRRNVARQAPGNDKDPAMRTIEPIRTEMEVFRF